MVHFPALPGSPLYDEKKGLDFIYSSIEADLINLQKAGVDAIMFGNENDRPYELNVNKATLSTMAFMIGINVSPKGVREYSTLSGGFL